MQHFALLAVSVAGLFGQAVPGQYIVELDTPSVAEQLPRLVRSANAAPQRERIRRSQRDARVRLEGHRARVFGEVENVANALFVELSGDEAMARLRATAGVRKVYRMREFKRVMDQAVLLHRAADVWSRVGAGNAGAGVKVAVIDSGIEIGHPAFQDSSMKAPDGFPRYGSEADAANTSGKVIVARSYVSMLSRRDPDLTARDQVGHGTALASIIAGVRTAGPLATITSMAPKAYLGVYKVFGSPGFNDTTTDAAILKAVDDAVADGMDIINLSLGSDIAPRPEDDPEVLAIERATRAGVLVVVAAGNNGPGLNTISSPGTAPSAVTAGAVTNSRKFSTSVELSGSGTFVAASGSGPAPAAPVTAPVADVAEFDGTGLGCNALPARSLSGKAALLLRGTCTFETKIGNVQAAGAVAAVVYAAADSPDPIPMAVGAATLPAEMVSHEAGAAIRQAAGSGTAVVTLNFTLSPVPMAANRRAEFSAAGPNADTGTLKPDLVAVGSNVYMATQTLNRSGDMYDPSGFLAAGGTSFSAPIVAGAAALLKSARPGLTVEQYKSLLVNTVAGASGIRGEAAGLVQTGAGALDVLAGLDAPVTAAPTSLSFGSGGGSTAQVRTLSLTNLSAVPDTFTVETAILRGSSGPSVEGASAAPGQTVQVPVKWIADGLSSGTYEGFLIVRSSASGTSIRVPYWYAVSGPAAASITILSSTASGRRSGLLRDSILFRVLDESGLNVPGVTPEVVVESGSGTVQSVSSYDSEVPGLYGATVRLGPAAGANVFRIKAGEAAATVTIAGQ